MLTQEQFEGLSKEFDATVGCPVTTKDRLEAFALGARSMLEMVKNKISVDAPAQQ